MGDAENRAELVSKLQALAAQRSTSGAGLFALYDGDKDGELTRDELVTLLADADVGNGFTRGAWATGILTRVDVDHSGGVTLPELAGVLASGQPPAPPVTAPTPAPAPAAPAAPPAAPSKGPSGWATVALGGAVLVPLALSADTPTKGNSMLRDSKTLLGLGALALIVFVVHRNSNASGLTEEQIKARRRAM